MFFSKLFVISLLISTSYAFGQTAASAKYDFPSLLFPPDLSGVWFSPNDDLTDTAENILRKHGGTNIDIASTRIKQIPFLSNDTRSTVILEASPSGSDDAHYILIAIEKGEDKTVGGLLVLDGTAASIVTFMKKMKFYIDSPLKAKEYLRFFASSVSGGGGISIVVGPAKNRLDEKILPSSDLHPIETKENDDGSFTVASNVVAGNALLDSVFRINRDGTIKKESEIRVRTLPLERIVVMNGSLRSYAPTQDEAEKEALRQRETKIHQALEELLKNGKIAYLQSALKDLGYDPGPIDGVFGGKTRSALDTYYSDHPHLTRTVSAPKASSGAPTEKEMRAAVIHALQLKTGSETKGDLIIYRAMIFVIAFRINDFEKISCSKLNISGYQCDYSMRIKILEGQKGLGAVMEKMIGGVGDILSARFVRARSGWRAILPN